MKRTLSLFLAAASLLVAQALLLVPLAPSGGEGSGAEGPAPSGVTSARASTRPRYCGTLRVELSARVALLDSAEKPADGPEAIAKQRLLNLAFDPLVRLDANGQPKPALALSWKSDAASKRWEFRLRPGVKFHDGTPLAPSDVVAALAKERESWRVSASGDSILILCDEAHPNLPFELALVFISRRAGDDALVGTGPFRITSWQPGARAVFSANEDYWEGRPFVDSIEVEMGRPRREQLLDFELGKTDLIELAPDQLRALAQSGKKTWSSAPVQFYGLDVVSTRFESSTSDFRDALSLAIDRAAIHNVLLQKQGEVASGCLPQWLSGYSFLLSTVRNLDDARKSLAKLPAVLPPLTFAYDSADPLARAIAERVALNAREIGVTLQVKPRNQLEKDARHDIELFRRHVGVPNAGVAMDFVCPSNHWGYWAMKTGGTEQMYKLELDSRAQAPYRVPLFYLPESFAIAARVKNWTPFRWGEWRLADVWLAPDESIVPPAPKGPEKP
ncbi:MAG: ABC transporter substrate-binding protein [Acidobacteria bacterium]|nr:ABC transporter substrate-binding protein [Acidobacteriota bacterium]